jgi:hypothetical protein
VNLAAQDRLLVHLISRAYPPAMKADPPPDPAAEDWPSIFARAERHGLAPLLFDSMKTTGRLQEIPAPVLLEFRRAYLRSANRNEEYLRELAALLDSLSEANIPVIVLKGGVLAVALYDSPSHRPMCDLDFLIPKESLPLVLEILKIRGFVGYQNLGGGFEQEFASHLCTVRSDASRLTVEPHWHLFNPVAYAARIPVEWFWRHAEPIEIRGRPAQMLSPMATLLHLSAHHYIHHQRLGLRSLYDIARLLMLWSDRIDGEELTETARSFQLLWAVTGAVREAAAVWQVPFPARFSPEAGSSVGIPTPETMTASRYMRHVRNLAGMTGWRARWTYLWKLVFPSREYLRQRYGMRREGLRALYYGYRILRGVAAIPVMLWALARRPDETRDGKASG